MNILEENELRIGNLVLDSTKNTTVVESVIPEHNRVRYGIQLTEELLLKFGFVKEYNTDEGENRDCFYLNNSDDSFYINYDTSYNGWYLGASTYGFLTEIYYVHQLQNLYFALTGTELEIK